MSELVLKVIHEKDEFTPGKWTSTTWLIYDDLNTIMNIRYYMNDAKDEDVSKQIAQDKYDQIMQLLESAKRTDVSRFALDGSGWSFWQYEGGKEIYKRNRGSIDGLYDFEKLERVLYSINKKP